MVNLLYKKGAANAAPFLYKKGGIYFAAEKCFATSLQLTTL